MAKRNATGVRGCLASRVLFQWSRGLQGPALSAAEAGVKGSDARGEQAAGVGAGPSRCGRRSRWSASRPSCWLASRFGRALPLFRRMGDGRRAAEESCAFPQRQQSDTGAGRQHRAANRADLAERQQGSRALRPRRQGVSSGKQKKSLAWGQGEARLPIRCGGEPLGPMGMRRRGDGPIGGPSAQSLAQ